jgi:hypothetical protein
VELGDAVLAVRHGQNSMRCCNRRSGHRRKILAVRWSATDCRRVHRRSCGRQVAGTYVGAMSGEGTEIAFHSDWSRPQFPQRKIRCSPAVRAAHGTVSTDLNSMS